MIFLHKYVTFSLKAVRLFLSFINVTPTFEALGIS